MGISSFWMFHVKHFASDKTEMFHVERFEKELKAAEKDLLVYREKLLQWQKSVNLISNKTAADIWQRHFIDSARVFDFIPAVAKASGSDGQKITFSLIMLRAPQPREKRLRRPAEPDR